MPRRLLQKHPSAPRVVLPALLALLVGLPARADKPNDRKTDHVAAKRNNQRTVPGRPVHGRSSKPGSARAQAAGHGPSAVDRKLDLLLREVHQLRQEVNRSLHAPTNRRSSPSPVHVGRGYSAPRVGPGQRGGSASGRFSRAGAPGRPPWAGRSQHRPTGPPPWMSKSFNQARPWGPPPWAAHASQRPGGPPKADGPQLGPRPGQGPPWARGRSDDRGRPGPGGPDSARGPSDRPFGPGGPGARGAAGRGGPARPDGPTKADGPQLGPKAGHGPPSGRGRSDDRGRPGPGGPDTDRPKRP